jgi:hypothetical protein
MLNKAWDISPNPPIVAIIYLAHSTRLHGQPMGFHKADDFFRGRRVNKTKHATKTGNNLEIERLHQGEKRVKKVTDNMIKTYEGDPEGFIYKYEAGIIDENTGEELCEPCLKQDTWIRKYEAANRALLDSVASKEFQDPDLGFEKVHVNSDHPGPVDSKPAQEKNMGVKERAANTGPLDTAARNSVSKQVSILEEEDEILNQERKDYMILFGTDMNPDPFLFEDDPVHAQFSQAKAVSTEASVGPAQDKLAGSALYWRGTFNTVHDQNEGWGKPCAEEKLEDLQNPLERDSADRYLDGDTSPSVSFRYSTNA